MTDVTQEDTDQIRTRVWALLHNQFGPAADRLTEDGEFVNTLADGFDSLTALDLIGRVEAEFGIEVDFVAHDVRHWFASPGRITRFVQEQLEDRAALGGAR
jgi:acyl carrier protein